MRKLLSLVIRAFNELAYYLVTGPMLLLAGPTYRLLLAGAVLVIVLVIWGLSTE